jgi:hypothetical protein
VPVDLIVNLACYPTYALTIFMTACSYKKIVQINNIQNRCNKSKEETWCKKHEKLRLYFRKKSGHYPKIVSFPDQFFTRL